MSTLKKIDETLKGAKTYLTSGVGVVAVAYLQSKGIDAVGVVDTLISLLDNATVQAVALWAAVQSALRAIMPDKRGEA